jgi:hypothetical protein
MPSSGNNCLTKLQRKGAQTNALRRIASKTIKAICLAIIFIVLILACLCFAWYFLWYFFIKDDALENHNESNTLNLLNSSIN